MVYVGSKRRIKKYILPIIQKAIDENKVDTYIEPFVGGANIIDSVKCKRKIGYDKNKYLIALYKGLQQGRTLPDFPCIREEYNHMRLNKEKYDPFVIGLNGFLNSFSSKFWAGYSFRGEKECYYTQMKNNILKQLPNLLDIEFKESCYLDIPKTKNKVYYLDPPYMIKEKYYKDSVNYEEFWNWTRELSQDNIVFISELNAPEDFECIWQKEIISGLKTKRYGKKRQNEKLFVLKK